MKVLNIVDGEQVTLELSFEDARKLALACYVASNVAYGDTKAMEHAGLPEEGTPAAATWAEVWSVYHTALEMLALAMLHKDYLTPDPMTRLQPELLRNAEPPDFKWGAS